MIDLKKYITPATMLLALAPATAALAVPGTAPQVPTNTPIVFQTSEVDSDRFSGAVEGTLRLTFADDGIVFGTFRTADGIRTVDVHGGLTGQDLYLDIGNETPINATIRNGNIVGYRLLGRDQFQFTAVPSTTQRT